MSPANRACNYPLLYLCYSTECQGFEGDVVFVIDGSDDIDEANWELQLQFVSDMILSFDVGFNAARIGVAQYGSSGDSLIYLNSNMVAEDIVDSVLNVEREGGSRNTYRGVREMTDEQFRSSRGDRDSNVNVAVIVTMGQPERTDRIAAEIEDAFEKNIDIIAIGVKESDIVESILISMCSEPQNEFVNYFFVDTFDDLLSSSLDLAYDVAAQVCRRQITISTTPMVEINPPEGGFPYIYVVLVHYLESCGYSIIHVM